ncbi:hypothetical protein ACH5RR_023794 [Cinchona calisaya]|uniref:Uncharacterized protein n=1 Tax=Cinchona calisaya TaxID=153742 RepID=A0ABD2ZET3_9GENT
MVDYYVNFNAYMKVANNVGLPLVVESAHVSTEATQVPQAAYQNDELVQDREVAEVEHAHATTKAKQVPITEAETHDSTRGDNQVMDLEQIERTEVGPNEDAQVLEMSQSAPMSLDSEWAAALAQRAKIATSYEK